MVVNRFAKNAWLVIAIAAASLASGSVMPTLARSQAPIPSPAASSTEPPGIKSEPIPSALESESRAHFDEHQNSGLIGTPIAATSNPVSSNDRSLFVQHVRSEPQQFNSNLFRIGFVNSVARKSGTAFHDVSYDINLTPINSAQVLAAGEYLFVNDTFVPDQCFEMAMAYGRFRTRDHDIRLYVFDRCKMAVVFTKRLRDFDWGFKKRGFDATFGNVPRNCSSLSVCRNLRMYTAFIWTDPIKPTVEHIGFIGTSSAFGLADSRGIPLTANLSGVRNSPGWSMFEALLSKHDRPCLEFETGSGNISYVASGNELLTSRTSITAPRLPCRLSDGRQGIQTWAVDPPPGSAEGATWITHVAGKRTR